MGQTRKRCCMPKDTSQLLRSVKPELRHQHEIVGLERTRPTHGTKRSICRTELPSLKERYEQNVQSNRDQETRRVVGSKKASSGPGPKSSTCSGRGLRCMPFRRGDRGRPFPNNLPPSARPRGRRPDRCCWLRSEGLGRWTARWSWIPWRPVWLL